MMTLDRGALLSDLAETYHIFNYKELPCSMVALFSCELREESRIKMKLNGMKVSQKEMLLAAIADKLSMLVWFGSEDGAKGINRPKLILDTLLENDNEHYREIMAFESGREFDVRWKAMVEQKGE